MGQHWMFLTVCGFALAAIVGFSGWWIYGRVMLMPGKYCHGYSRVPTVSPASLSPTRRARLAVPTLLRRVSFKEDEEAAPVTETSYEFYSRRD